MISPGCTVEDFPTSQDFFQKGIKTRQPVGNFCGRAHQEIQRKVAGPAEPGNAAAALGWRHVVSIHDHQQIHVAVSTGFAIGIGAEQDNLLRMELLGDLLGECSQCRIGEEFLGHRETEVLVGLLEMYRPYLGMSIDQRMKDVS